jgi:hypothetical protein
VLAPDAALAAVRVVVPVVALAVVEASDAAAGEAESRCRW